MLKLGTIDISDMKLGTTQVLKAYLGTTLVWEKGSIPVPSPGPYLTTLTSVQEGATVSLVWDGGSVTGTTSTSAEIPAGTLVTYTVTLDDKTDTDTVLVLRETKLTIDLSKNKNTLNVFGFQNQTDGTFFEQFIIRVRYANFDATYLMSGRSGAIKFQSGVTASLSISDLTYKCTTSSSASTSVSASYAAHQNGVLTLNFTPTDADVVVHDNLNNLVPPITMDKVNGVATYYQPYFSRNASRVTVVVRKAGYIDKSQTYEPTARTDKTLTINL